MRYCFFAALVLCATGVTCHADTLTTFNFAATIADSGNPMDIMGSASGTMTVDVTTGIVTGLNIFASATDPYLLIYMPGTADTFSNTFTTLSDQTANYPPTYEVIATSSPGGGLFLFLPVNSLVGYTGSAICTALYPCGPGNQGGYSIYQRLLYPGRRQILETEFFTSGSLTPVGAPTPEPPGLLLLGTGGLSIMAGLRRRLR